MENLRSFPIERYIVFFVPTADGIELVRVLPAARDINFTDFATVTEGNA